MLECEHSYDDSLTGQPLDYITLDVLNHTHVEERVKRLSWVEPNDFCNNVLTPAIFLMHTYFQFKVLK